MLNQGEKCMDRNGQQGQVQGSQQVYGVVSGESRDDPTLMGQQKGTALPRHHQRTRGQVEHQAYPCDVLDLSSSILDHQESP